MRLGLTIAAATLCLLAGCSEVSTSPAKPTTGRNPQVAEIPDADETVRGAEEPPVVHLQVGSRLRERKLTKSDPLPSSVIVPNTNLNAVPVTAALQAVLAGTDISLSWEAGTFENRLVTVTNLSGPLSRVVDKICTSAKVFCSHRNGLLELRDKETFVIELPSVPTKSASGSSGSAATNTMAETIGDLAGQKPQIDQQGGNLLYTTDVIGHEKVEEYLTQLRHGRPLLVLQLYVWEVALNKNNGTGINWKSFNLGKLGGNYQNMVLSGSSAFTEVSNAGVSLGAKLSGKIDADTVIKFLSTQGTVQTISNPQLTFVSGSSAEFRVGGEKRYISQVGQLTSGTVSGSNSTSTGIGTNTVSTDKLETGLTVSASGNFESGIISALLEIQIEDVVSLNPTTTENGVTVDLPETSERKVQTSLRVRPGDNLVLAGLVSSRDNNNREGIPFFGRSIPTLSSDELRNSEMVVMVKPSIVLFEDAPEAAPKPVRSSAPTPILDAVVIDKDGPRTLKIPGDADKTKSSEPDDFIMMDEQPEAKPARKNRRRSEADVPVFDPPPESWERTTAQQSMPVDNSLMQRGFSHAYDDMLASDTRGGAL